VPEGDPLGDESREAIRRNIVDLMLLAPAQVQRQVGEAVTIIADYDFPHKWDYLLQVCSQEAALAKPAKLRAKLRSTPLPSAVCSAPARRTC